MLFHTKDLNSGECCHAKFLQKQVLKGCTLAHTATGILAIHIANRNHEDSNTVKSGELSTTFPEGINVAVYLTFIKSERTGYILTSVLKEYKPPAGF